MTKTIMVVDDEQDIRDTLKTILKKNKYDVITAYSADDCYAQIQKGANPDLILMDIMMPGTPVKKIVAKISKKIKVIYLSVVRVSDAQKEHLLNTHVVAYLQKPFDINELLQEIKKHTK